MTQPVADRMIFHITHLDNLGAILADGCLWSDYELQKTRNRRTLIGFGTIKTRRLEELRVLFHPSTFVGHYVPYLLLSTLASQDHQPHVAIRQDWYY